jgi:hypothetical protein
MSERKLLAPEPGRLDTGSDPRRLHRNTLRALLERPGLRWPGTRGREPAPSVTPLPQVREAPRHGREPDRYELKYWVPEALADQVACYAASYLIVDPFCSRLGLKSQWNTSLYLDTMDYQCFRRHVDSAPDRFKLRVRVYGVPPSGPEFFETKRKVKGVIVKTRTMVPAGTMTSLLEGTYESLPPLKPHDRRNLEGFLYLQHMHRTVPCVLVRCLREAYGSEDPIEDIRLTIDRSITFQPARGYTLECDPRGWVPIDGFEQHGKQGPHAMVELKFPRIAPLWMRQLVQNLEMWRVGYSKYVSAVRQMLEQPYIDNLDRDSTSAERA